MTMPLEYFQASKDFDRFIVDVRDTAMLQTHHQAYQVLRAVLHVFRSHLTIGDALRFADVLPPVVRAIFVESWDPDEEPAPFPDRAALYREVKHVRPGHNIAPESAITDVAAALRRHVDAADFDRVLAGLPKGAAAFWTA